MIRKVLIRSTIITISMLIMFFTLIFIFGHKPLNNEDFVKNQAFFDKCQSVGFTVDQCHFFRNGAGDDNDDGGTK